MKTDMGQIETLQQAFTSMPAGERCEDCPDPGRLWAAVRLELPAEERRRIVQHLAVCTACAEDWRVTWKLSQEQQGTEAPSNGELIPGPWTRIQEAWPQVAAAALVVLAVGTGGFVFHKAPESSFRGHSEQTAQQAEGVTPDGAVLPRDEFVLRWPATEGAEYELLVMTESGVRLATKSGLRESEFRVPLEKLGEVPSGTQLHWHVTVFGGVERERVLGPFSTVIE